MRPLTQRILFPLALVAATALAAPAASQEDESPLRLAYINAGDSGSAASFQVVESMLVESPQIDLMDAGEFVAVAESAGLVLSDFAQGSRREVLIDEFELVLRATDREGVLVHDTFSGTAQIVVIGPQGWEIADVRRSLSRGTLSDDNALDALQEVFLSLVPEVRGYRRDLEEARIAEAQAAAAEEEEEVDEEPMEIHPDEGNLQPYVAARGGLLMGQRLMNLDQPEGVYSVTHLTSLMGVALSVDALFTTFTGGDAGLVASARLGWAPFGTDFGDEDLRGTFLRVGADLQYLMALSSAFRVRGIGGLEIFNIALDANPNYTGHGYVSARLGAGIDYAFGRLMTFQFDGLYLGVLHSSNSAGAYGDASSRLGFGVESGLHLELFDPVVISGTYGFYRFSMAYEAPQVLQQAAQTRDTLHQGGVTVGYRF